MRQGTGDIWIVTPNFDDLRPPRIHKLSTHLDNFNDLYFPERNYGLHFQFCSKINVVISKHLHL